LFKNPFKAMECIAINTTAEMATLMFGIWLTTYLAECAGLLLISGLMISDVI
jgi:hypothetical protein